MNLDKKRMEQNQIKSMGAMLEAGELYMDVDKTKFIPGCPEFNLCYRKYSQGDMIPIIAASGLGKTALLLMKAKSILEHNPDKIFIMVSLEMRESELSPRFAKMAKGNMDLWNRFFVISNYDSEGNPKKMTLAKIKKEIELIKDVTGKEIAVIGLDHINLLKNEGKDLNNVCNDLKEIAVSNKCLMIPLAQIPKGPKQQGDIPVDADDAFGISDLKWLAHYVITIHRPLERVREEANLPITAWQFAKIRDEHEKDEVKPKSNKLLFFDIENYQFRDLTIEEVTKFKMWYESVLELRDAEEKKKSFVYELKKKIKMKDGSYREMKEEWTGSDEL